MSYSLIIPAQEKNRYHEEGDFSPFGGTSLIEWKVSQCIETINKSDIYIASSSQKPIAICKKYGINFIKRQEAQSLETDLIDIAKQITTEYVLWANPTSPFIGGEEYKSALNVFFNSDKHDSLISTVEKREYMFFENKKNNFKNHSDGREILQPIYIATNGFYISSRKNILEGKGLIGKDPLFYNMDFFESLEIVNTKTYNLMNELIAQYFNKKLEPSLE